MLFGLGKNQKVDEIRVRWPSGIESTLKDPGINKYLTIREAPTKDAGANSKP
jgi:hypothetical protein